MNNQVQKQATEVQALVKKERMTSVEIAEITGKQHKNVMQAIRAMEPAWEKVYGLKFQLIQRISDLGNGRTRKDPCYSLTKTECLYIATKFNDEARARLILRWEELEKELLRAPRPAEPSEKDRVLPLPICKPQAISDLTEIVDGRAVTTSRKLAAVLGRKHHSVLRTINQNLHRREFKYGHFIRRKYTSGRCGHGPEYLITRKGLSALAEAMRGGAAEKIAEAYAGAWGKTALSDRAIPSPAPEQLRLPLGAESVQPESNVTTEGNAGDSEYDELVNLLAHRLGALAKELAASRATQRTYSELYEREKRMRQEAAADKGMWADLYTDLLYNVAESDRGSLDERLEAHKNFRNKMLRKVKLS